jgi:predicted tellurium resistance membrane protein TerC
MTIQAPVQPNPTSAPGGAPATSAPPSSAPMSEGQRKAIIIGAIAGAVVVVVVLVAGAIFLLNNPAAAANVRDVMIIFMALEFIFIGAALVVLMFQLAVLTNMLRHEIKPILDSTSETINTVRGTTTFLSENLVEPVVKLNSYLAAITQVVDSLGMLGRFGRRKN